MSESKKPDQKEKADNKKLEINKESVRNLTDKPKDALRPPAQTSDCGAGGCHP
jgi:hypothetical protein